MVTAVLENSEVVYKPNPAHFAQREWVWKKRLSEKIERKYTLWFFARTLSKTLEKKDDRDDGLDFFCQGNSSSSLFKSGTECIVTCPPNFKPSDPVIQCSCFRYVVINQTEKWFLHLSFFLDRLADFATIVDGCHEDDMLLCAVSVHRELEVSFDFQFRRLRLIWL